MTIDHPLLHMGATNECAGTTISDLLANYIMGLIN